MGIYDASDRYLKRALNIRSEGQSSSGSNMRIVVPIIKLKSEQFKIEALNLPFEEKVSKLRKILAVLENKLKDQGEGLKDDTKTEIKSILLKH
jgi:hypothetical protein